MRGRNSQSSSDRVLQATFACVARYGIAKTSVEDVARAAGISRATVYRLFPGGKDQLVAETVKWESTRFFNELAAAIEDAPDFTTTVEEAMFFAHAALAQHAVFQKVMETEPELLLPQLSVDDERIRSLVRGFLQTHLRGEEQRLATGQTPETVAEHVSRLFMSFLGASGSWDLTDREQVRQMVRTELLAGVFAE